MKKLVLPASLLLLLILTFLFWFPREKPTAPTLTLTSPSPSQPVAEAPPDARVPPGPVLQQKEVKTDLGRHRDVPSSALDDIGGEALSDAELANIEKADKQMNLVRERWAEERQKIYRRLNVTEEEEKQLASAADDFEGDFQTGSQPAPNESPKGSRSLANEIDRELADASERFDKRTLEILGPERFDNLIRERDQFNARLRAEGLDARVGSFW